MLIANNKSEKDIVPSWIGSAVSNSVVYLAGEPVGERAILVFFFFAYKKILGRTETRTRDRMYLGRIRSVRDISRDDRARIATCSLRTPTDRFKANYSEDIFAINKDFFNSLRHNITSIMFKMA